MSHRNARLTLHGRLLLVRRVLDDRRPVAHVAKELGVSRQCAHLWVNPFRSEGEAGLAAWRGGNFTAAIDSFEKALAARKDDAASSLMIERCRQQLENPAAENWDGTTVAQTK